MDKVVTKLNEAVLRDKRIRIIIGHYGSGKTEFSVNYALALAETGRKTSLADLDVINPYFRSREKAEFLESNGVHVISSVRGHSANIDIPMVSAEVFAPLQDSSQDVVLDVGGDSVGARAIAQFRHYFVPGQYDMFCVINRYREQTMDAEGVIEHIKAIEASAGAKVTGLINNTHLLRETTLEDVLYGQELAEEVSKMTGLPIRYVSAIRTIAEQLPGTIEGTVLPIAMYMREDWM
jgi:hypothetical protein